ncbi:TerB N-terminal domain-containing protein [Pseudomonas sp. BGr12]|uniref:tellurite resistance TerB family protein n=1 Tax=Pseudomonas sp. BGr12 TaxID=2936269 RepID=UPI002559DE88|nr:TerB N-terminal domain-containing protein [Pseudomonas sp. BJa5]MDL2428487.1 TerB N-terminal domain-containing protein [Pseudomonas sp. BJa5]
MARKRRGKKSNASGGLVLVVVFWVILASLPKAAWLYICIAIVVGGVLWLLSKASKKSPSIQVSQPPHSAASPPDSQGRGAPRRAQQPVSSTGSAHASAPAERDLSEFFTISLEVSEPAAFRIPDRPAELAKLDARWLSAGELFEVAGEKISGGMIYVGNKAARGQGHTEPSMINPKLSVARGVVDIAQRLTSYWPSYESISPEARRAYLQWLSSGRKAPHANIGYVFLFFYGLERRALVDAKTDPVAAAEVPAVIAEVERLLPIYAENNSFQGYACRFLDFISTESSRERRYLTKPPVVDPTTYDMPADLRLGLGQLALDKQPVPADWALAWVYSDYNISLRTPATRCQAEFAKLFGMKYKEQYREGIVLPQNKTKLKIEYRPASNGLPAFKVDGTENLPDVTAVTGPRNKLQKLADECTAELDSYSRYLGRNPDSADSLEAVLQLPISLWPEATRSELEQLKERIGEGMIVMSFGELAGRLKSAGALSRDKVLALARALESLHIGLQPDVLGGSRIPKAEDPIALFATLPEDGELRSSPAYGAASVTLDLACAVAAADGDTSPQEIMALSRHIDSWSHLSAAHRKRLKAHLRLQLNQPPTLQSLKKRLEPLDQSAKRSIVAFLAHLAQADGEVSPAEVKLLERVYKALQLDAQLLYSDLHIAASGQPVSAPIASTQASSVTTSGGSNGFVLDEARIALLQAETEQVSKLLAQVFVDEQVVEPVEEEGAEEEVSGSTNVWSLDAEHSAFLRLLVTRSEWSRDELEAVASDMELMLDGALEHVNDAAFDLFDMPVTEGEEPVEINPEIMEKLTV